MVATVVVAVVAHTCVALQLLSDTLQDVLIPLANKALAPGIPIPTVPKVHLDKLELNWAGKNVIIG